MTELQYRALADFKADGRTVQGTVVAYGDIARLPSGFETFKPGSIVYDDVRLNVQHDKGRILARTGAGVELFDSPTKLELRATLPETREADDVLTLLKSNVLRGLSAEFHIVKSHHQGASTRVIDKAELVGVGIVDNPAYTASTVEARAELQRRTRPFRLRKCRWL